MKLKNEILDKKFKLLDTNEFIKKIGNQFVRLRTVVSKIQTGKRIVSVK